MNESAELFEIFPWDDNLETGIAKIDEQHKKLVDILNRLAAHLANLSNVIDLNEVFDELVDYTDYHFKTEEGIWTQYFEGDAWLETHEKTHDTFLSEILEIKKNQEKKEFDEVIYDVVLFLSQWLAYHILDTDKRMAKAVLEMQLGHSLEKAKKHSDAFMNGSIKTLVGTVLKMYGDISSRTIDLMREKALRLKAEKALKISEERWKFILDSSSENIWDWDIEHDKVSRFKDGINITEVLKSELQKIGSFSKIHPDDIEKTKAAFLAHVNGETEFYSNKHRVLREDGSWIWVLSRGKVVSRDENGVAKHIIGTHSDVTQRELASIIFNSSSQAMFISDVNNNIIGANPAFTQITQYEVEDVIGKNPKILSSGKMDKLFFKNMWSEMLKKSQWSGEVVNKRKNGEIYIQDLKINVVKDSDNNIDHYVALFSDISEKKKADELIKQQADFDGLTQLENRRMFTVRLTEVISNAKRTGLSFAVFFIDLDHFKDINDTLGHTIGDSVLVQAAARIQAQIRDSDILARFGGDEFTLILPNVKNLTAIERVAQNIIKNLKKPFIMDKETLYISASIGITLYPEDGKDEQTLLKNADQAMYQAKKTGRSRFNYYTHQMQKRAQNRQKMLADMHTAIKQKQFEMYYQPIVDLQTGNILKAEALIRWNHPQKGLVSPFEFISLAEQTGLIVALGDWIFEESTAQAQRWREKYNSDFKISINKSPVQFKSRDSLDGWMAHLKKIGLDGSCIIIEITESLLIDDDDIVTEKLLRFRDEGVEISIDDFGTGYSSLSYLKKLDIDYIKIDKSFVDNLSSSQQDKILCEAMIVMAHKLGLKVVAEGVEKESQREILLAMGCDYIQGYIYSKPVPADAFERLYLK